MAWIMENLLETAKVLQLLGDFVPLDLAGGLPSPSLWDFRPPDSLCLLVLGFPVAW